MERMGVQATKNLLTGWTPPLRGVESNFLMQRPDFLGKGSPALPLLLLALARRGLGLRHGGLLARAEALAVPPGPREGADEPVGQRGRSPRLGCGLGGGGTR